MNVCGKKGLVWIGTGLLMSLAFLFVFASPSKAATGEVEVFTSNGLDSTTVSLSSLGSPTTSGAAYGLDSTIEGYTVGQVLAKASEQGLDSTGVEGFEIARAKANMVVLTKVEATSSSAFGGKPPFFYEKDDGSTHFVMKKRNASGFFDDAFLSRPPSITFARDTGITVDLNADRVHVDVGDPVSFQATPGNLKSNEKVSYRWNFADGTTKTTRLASDTHTFKKEGEFGVLVTIIGQPSTRSNSAAKVIQVGPAPKDKKKDKKKDKEETPADTGTGGYSYPGGTGTGTGGYPGGTGTSPGAGSPTPSAPEPEPQPEPPVDDGLVEVTGELVSSSSPAPTMSPGEAAAQPPPAVVTPTPDGFKISSETWTVLGLLALLGFGLIAERRGSKLY